MFIENDKYEILTPSGWVDFKGLTKINDKITYRITLLNGKNVEATPDHYFFIDNQKVKLCDITCENYIDTIDGPQKVKSIEKLNKTTVYDVVEVQDPNHQFFVNSCFITKNCDEFAFVQPNIAGNFWASISPTLSTGGRAIITSTPNSDEDTFATIWKESQEKTDEYGNVIPDGIGRNGFFGFRAYWEEHPDRDEEWKQKELNKIGEENFRREFQCLTQDAVLTIKWPSGKIEKRSIGDVVGLLSQPTVN